MELGREILLEFDTPTAGVVELRVIFVAESSRLDAKIVSLYPRSFLDTGDPDVEVGIAEIAKIRDYLCALARDAGFGSVRFLGRRGHPGRAQVRWSSVEVRFRPIAAGGGYCLAMAEVIGKIKKKGRPLVLISHGSKEKHIELAVEHEWHSDVLIAPDYALMQEYQVPGTPSGYLVNEEGQIGSELAVGADDVMALLKAEPLNPDDITAEAEAPSARNGYGAARELASGSGAAPAMTTLLRVKGTSTSNIARDGLPAGTEAPNFVLPDLDGNVHALVDYRGKRVLLVFSDVDCGPCEAMLPELVTLAETHGEKLQVLMVSRGNKEANKRKAEAFCFPFPVMIQKGWQISKLYGMFATPIAYLIDESGIIERDVAAGAKPIHNLV